MKKNTDIQSEADIRKYVREVLYKKSLAGGNSEILSPEKKAKIKTQKLRTKLVKLLKVLDSGKYEEARKTMISQVI